MAIITNEELYKLTNSTSKTINNQVIELAKKVLFTRISTYITDNNELNMIRSRILNMKIELLSGDDFKETFYKCNGKGFVPGGFQYLGVIYFRNDLEFDSTEFHRLIHEMLHAISYHQENRKIGLYQIKKEEGYYYGRGLNEAFTEYLTSILLEDGFSGYSKDFYLVIQLFMQLTNLDIEKLLKLYISEKEWLSDEIINMFNANNKELVELIIEYDNKLSPTRKLNPNNVLHYLFNSINFKINNNEKIDCEKLRELLTQYLNYFYDVDYTLEEDIKIEMAEVLDVLGTYKNNMSNNER